MAALFFVGAISTGCSSEDDSTNQTTDPKPSKSITLTTIVSREGGADTRALTEGGVKTFAVGEQIAVVYTNTSSQQVVALSNALTADDITNEGKDAKITVTLTDPVACSVDYIYPATMANSDGTTNYSVLCMQDGTWASLSSKLDYAKGSGEMTGSGNKFTLPTITLANQLAICKFKVKCGSDITTNITGLTVSDGTNTYTVNRVAEAGYIYMAMQPVSEKTLSFVANDASNSYYKNVTNLTLAANNIYPLNVTMTQGRIINLSTLNADYKAKNGDMLTGKLAANHKISIAEGATVTLNGASINYDDTPALSGSFAGITCLGNATIIVSGTNYVKGFSSGYPGIFVPSGSTLTITGDGTLYALGHDDYGAGIGSGRSDIADVKNCGNIVIQGGTIWGTGGTGAAGIGSGAGADENPSTCGNITIRSSVINVYATAGSGAEPIGRGDHSTCGTVTIEAPAVTKK